MSRYDRFSNKNGSVYTPYVMLGYPTMESSIAAVRAVAQEGVDGLELGLPFRDPMADGPVIEKAGNVALDNGMCVDKALEVIVQIRQEFPDIALTLMCYYNMLVARGSEKFIHDFAAAGIDGFLIPDLPVDYADEVLPFAKDVGAKLVFIASPLTSNERLDLFREKSGGFVYVVTRLGITGVSENYADNLAELMGNIRQKTNLPPIAGFGISEPSQAQHMIASGAKGVITGSRLVQLIAADIEAGDAEFSGVREHTRAMVEAVSE